MVQKSLQVDHSDLGYYIHFSCQVCRQIRAAMLVATGLKKKSSITVFQQGASSPVGSRRGPNTFDAVRFVVELSHPAASVAPSPELTGDDSKSFEGLNNCNERHLPTQMYCLSPAQTSSHNSSNRYFAPA
uniref:Uncharacterized protein n=1 Tax=Kalanchoe fedtschenkoi TaxID=63787 RepID=A0A7N0UC73_KALFE